MKVEYVLSERQPQLSPMIMTRYILLLLLLYTPEHATAQSAQFPYLDFNYNHRSSRGPEFWWEVDVSNSEYLQWTKEYRKETEDPGMFDLDVGMNECDRSRQAPINLQPNEVCFDDHEILSRQIRRSDCKFDDFSWSITPHFLRATMPPDDTFCIRPHIDLPNGFGNDWILQYMELHVRAEHLLDGRRYDAELQMVHLGLDPNQSKVATISLMMVANNHEDDEKLQWMLDAWQAVADERDRKCDTQSPDDIRMERGLNLRTQKDVNGQIKSHLQKRKPSNEYVPERVHRHLNPSQHPAHAGEYDDINEEAEMLDWDHPSLIYGDSYRINNETGEVIPIVIDYDNDDDDVHKRNGRNLQQRIDPETGEIERKAPRQKMFPYIMSPTIYYYRYLGSMTSPPCAIIVNWRIMDEPLSISPRQLRQMASLLQGYKEVKETNLVDPKTGQNVLSHTCEPKTRTNPITGDNFRPLKVVDEPRRQPVVHCQPENFSFWRYWPEKQ